MEALSLYVVSASILVSTAIIFRATCPISHIYKAFSNACNYIRRRLLVNVNCWFCNKDLRVHFDDRNSWTCLECEQYNGFSPDGDYNCELSKLHYEYLNTSVYCVRNEKSQDLKNSNNLCATCNRNQVYKIQQLASFSPFNEEDFDREIEEYSTMLEKSYKICEKCEEVVQKAISETNTSIMAGKFAIARSQRLNSSQRECSIFIVLTKFMITVLSAIYLAMLLFKFNCYRTLNDWLKLNSKFGFYNFFLSEYSPNFYTFYSSFMEYLSENNIVILVTKLLLSLGLSFSNKFSFTNLYVWQTMFSLLSLVMCCNNQPTFDVINPLKVAYHSEIILSVISLLVSFKTLSWSSSRIINGSLTPNCEAQSVPTVKQNNFIKPKSLFTVANGNISQQQNHLTNHSTRSLGSDYKNYMISNGFDRKYMKNNIYQIGTCTSYPEYDNSVEPLLESILNLDGNSAPSISSQSVFSKRTYSSEIPKEFKHKPQKIDYKRSIIAPSKLEKKSIPNTWDDGYWSQSRKHMANMNSGFTPLSRTSSQSSGFESQGSIAYQSGNNSLPHSRSSSIFEDFDNLSVLSEPASHHSTYPISEKIRYASMSQNLNEFSMIKHEIH